MFAEKERLIFEYEAGGVKRFADPLSLRRGLLRASRGEFDAIDLESRDRPPVPDGAGGFVPQGPEDPGVVLAREDARERIHAVTCAAFGLAPFDPATGEGATEEESGALLDAFMDFIEKKGRGRGNSPASSAATDSPPDSPSTTPPTSASS